MTASTEQSAFSQSLSAFCQLSFGAQAGPALAVSREARGRRPWAVARPSAPPLVALLALAAACNIAPSRIDAEVELGDQQVRYRASLRDVRTAGGGLINSLPIFARVLTPPEEALRDLDWLPRPDTWRWEARDGGVDLEIAGALPRSVFDDCSRRGCSALDAGVPCKGFPVALCGARYELVGPKGDPGETRAWPATERSLHYSGRPNEEVARKGASALEAYELSAKDRGAFQETVSWLGEFVAAFQSGDVRRARSLAAASAIQGAAHGVRRLEETMAQAARRERQRLLYTYLLTRGYSSALEPPELEPFSNPYLSLLPARPLPEITALKLRVIYEVANRGDARGGRLADVTAMLVEACRAPRKEHRRFCDLLLLPPADPN